ncbi:signal peptidase I [Nocardioides caldifontis]|uniref:signal peptidase I n=1 Tax=Nocardioides caldifontis TaxID=2588938 RepID=UPI0011E047E4|nr:signal peptidase I [Nocardioides caldifontis]
MGTDERDGRTSSRPSPLQRLGNLAMVLVILGCAAWLAPSLLGYDRYVITGGSMSGTFEKGSVAFERQVPVEQLEVGDVITYLPPADSGTTDLVTHRIVSMVPDGTGRLTLRTKGDANASVDPWTFSLDRATQPVVVTTVPHVGHLFIALADPQLRMLAIGGPAAVIALLALGELAGALRERRRDARRAGHIPAQARGDRGAPVHA